MSATLKSPKQLLVQAVRTELGMAQKSLWSLREAKACAEVSWEQREEFAGIDGSVITYTKDDAMRRKEAMAEYANKIDLAAGLVNRWEEALTIALECLERD